MPKILLVEDEPLNTEIVERILRTQRYEVITASDGPTGVALAKSARPDIILMDMALPNQGDGQQATREIRADPDLTGVPIIALTARCMPLEVEEMRQVGCNEVLPKPVDFRQLLKLISETLKVAGTQ